MTDAQLTIPSHYYTDPDYYRIEKEKILYRTWQFACHANDISEPGSYHTTDVADESIVLVRGQDNEIRAFYNICRHRAHRIAEGHGQCQLLRCPYHAWAYDLEGSLVAAPGAGDVDGFDKASVQLRSVKVENFCGLLFVNLDEEAASIDTLFPTLRDDLLSYKPGLESMVRVHEDILPHESNWKVSVENYSECYHCSVAHKFSVSNIYSGSEYRITIDQGLVRHFTPSLQDREKHGDLHIWFLWPNFAIQLYPLYRSISVRHFKPTGPRNTDYNYVWYVDPDLPDSARQEVIDLSQGLYHTTNGIEDQNIVRNVQLGLESRSYDKGCLMLPPEPTETSEHAVAFFQEEYLAAIGES